MREGSPPYVSVIVPVYKTSLDYFKQCLESLHAQTLLEAEFIIVFDGENAELHTLCESYKEKDNRFQIYVLSHEGVSTTRNYGIARATGFYIAFVDADDILCNSILSKAYTFAIENASDIIIWDCSIYDGIKSERRSISHHNIGQLNSEQREDVLKSVISMKDPNWISTAGPWCKLYRNEILRETPFDSKFTLRQDRILNIKLFSKNLTISYLHENGYLYRIHDESAVRTRRHNLLQISSIFIDAMEEISGNLYPEGIGLETFRSLWEAWSNSVLDPCSSVPLIKRVSEFNKILKMKQFRKHLNRIENYKDFPIPVKLELFLLKNGITFSMWLRAFIWNLKKTN
ncbi:MAG: glycosyltransferase [Fibrobacter sp.]|nr:glycosyltransferase [Fibrobacter sp.]